MQPVRSLNVSTGKSTLKMGKGDLLQIFCVVLWVQIQAESWSAHAIYVSLSFILEHYFGIAAEEAQINRL